MRFSIITPSFRNSKWLRLCIPSVADQEGVTLEHIVQDSCSDDGTGEWLPRDPRVKAFIEKDSGMYDGVNRGLRRAQGELLAYLNCDEQYLPGTLKAVDEYFRQHPEVEMLFADLVVIDAQANYICDRKVLLPLKPFTRVCTLGTFTCATFFRRRIIDELGLFFDTKWRNVGDADWMLRLLDRKVNMAVLRRFVSAFTDSGENMGLNDEGQREQLLMRQSAPWWARHAGPLLTLHHRFRRLTNGVYRQAPFTYSVYTLASPSQRVLHRVDRPTSVWKTRLGYAGPPSPTNSQANLSVQKGQS